MLVTLWLKKVGKSPKAVEQSGVFDDEGMLFGDIFGEEKAAYDTKECELENFMMDDQESYRERSFVSCFKMSQKKNKLRQMLTTYSFALNDVGHIIIIAIEILSHQKQFWLQLSS